MKKSSKSERDLRVVNPDAAGIDIGSVRHYVAMRWTPSFRQPVGEIRWIPILLVKLESRRFEHRSDCEVGAGSACGKPGSFPVFHRQRSPTLKLQTGR